MRLLVKELGWAIMDTVIFLLVVLLTYSILKLAGLLP